jgi:hypothetical protein
MSKMWWLLVSHIAKKWANIKINFMVAVINQNVNILHNLSNKTLKKSGNSLIFQTFKLQLDKVKRAK